MSESTVERKSQKVPCLDHGYVRLIDTLGNDLTVVNAARVSFDKESSSLSDRDRRLLAFLGREGHTSPFRHAALSFEFYAPLMVARQAWKYIVGSDHTMDAWNESSRRYVTEDPTFYIPREWRASAVNRKQGSSGSVGENTAALMNQGLRNHIARSVEMYEQAIAEGVAVEQARLFLPAYGMYVRWRWTASLQSVCHFLSQRLADDAQREIAEYAQAVKQLVEPLFPEAVKAYLGEAA